MIEGMPIYKHLAPPELGRFATYLESRVKRELPRLRTLDSRLQTRDSSLQVALELQPI